MDLQIPGSPLLLSILGSVRHPAPVGTPELWDGSGTTPELPLLGSTPSTPPELSPHLRYLHLQLPSHLRHLPAAPVLPIPLRPSTLTE